MQQGEVPGTRGPADTGIDPSRDDISVLRPDIARAAQTIYDQWDQDEDGMDEDLGAGGICDGVADAIIQVITGFYPALECGSNYVEATTHVEVIARLSDGVHRIDIPPRVYETGAGYVWSKKPDVVIGPADVIIDLLDRNPARYGDFMHEEGLS